MAASKQFLLNYDSNILLPYTTLDCIIDGDNESLDASGIKGMDLITDKLLENIKQFIYNTTKSVSENQITSDKISNAYVLGISTLSDSSVQVYTKFHELDIKSPAYASGKYLGADGSTHEVKFDASFYSSDGWYSTSINVRPSGNSVNKEKPIAADVSININISDKCFDTSGGVLYSKYSDNTTTAKVAEYANMIGTLDVSTGIMHGSTIGPNKALQLNSGNLTAITGIGDSNHPIYITNKGTITALGDSVITTKNDNVGSSNRPVYLSNAAITAFNTSIGSKTIPVYLDGGEITPCTLDPTSITGADSSEGGILYLQSENGTKKWGAGNRTTAGTFDNRPDTVYYLVGIDSENKVDDSFKLLTGAKRNDDTGIYFKNYELFQTSDENLKTFTDEIDINFDNLATIKKGIYHWTDDPNKISDIGIGARSLEALYPEIVDENNGVKTVAYNRLGVIALAAIDKLHLRVKELETEMKELKEEIRTLKQGK